MKKGFTLIELLAVIVILAIIALIAVPIVLNIIKDAKTSSDKRSVELYGNAVEQAIARYQLKNEIIPGDYQTSTDGKNIIVNNKPNILVDYSGENISANVTINNDKSIYIYNIKKGDKELSYTYGHKVVCEFIDGTYGEKGEMGSKYSCKVKDGTYYNFYVLSKNDDDSINLILDRNVCNDGSLSTNENECSVNAHYSDSTIGPIEEYDYLQTISRNWDNIPLVKYNFTDDDHNPIIENYYKGIFTTGDFETNETKILSYDGSVSGIYTDLRVRLPEIEEITNITSQHSNKSEYKYLYDNYFSNGVIGYWTASYGNTISRVYSILISTSATPWPCDHSACVGGIRPVITIQNNNLG